MTTVFISGHGDLSLEEFEQHYAPAIDKAITEGCSFVVGDYRGADTFAQIYLFRMANEGHLSMDKVRVYHAGKFPRNNYGFKTMGGYPNQTQKDAAMTRASDRDIAWVRKGRENSGTGRNLERRKRNKP